MSISDDIENLFADLDLKNLAGTVTIEEVIASLTVEDLDVGDPGNGTSDQVDHPVKTDSVPDGPAPELKMKPDYFVPDERLVRAADAIANLAPCPIAGRITRDQVLLALGEFGDIWPDSIR